MAWGARAAIWDPISQVLAMVAMVNSGKQYRAEQFNPYQDRERRPSRVDGDVGAVRRGLGFD